MNLALWCAIGVVAYFTFGGLLEIGRISRKLDWLEAHVPNLPLRQSILDKIKAQDAEPGERSGE